VTIAVCTYKRPDRLRLLLDALVLLAPTTEFSVSIVVVDNDPQRSAQSTVQSFVDVCDRQVKYVSEPRPNIAAARNRCLSETTGEFCAFIDDDEIPEVGWLAALYRQMVASGAAAVLGPVVSRYVSAPERWVTQSRVFDRHRYTSGTELSWPDTRTGNVLLRMGTIRSHGLRFDPRFGKLGGEDVMFFRQLLRAPNTSVVWANDAVVYEWVTQRRACWRGMARRALTQGQISFYYESPTERWRCRVSGIAVAAVFVYWIAAPFLCAFRLGLGMRYILKSLHHLSRLSAAIGAPIVNGRKE
jgi:glycosyltransferase involved in cell wall biosynthesis